MRSYSGDLRRVVGEVDRCENSQREIAQRFEVSLPIVVRLLQHRRRTGGLEPQPHGGGAGMMRSVDERVRLFDLVRGIRSATLMPFEKRGFDSTSASIWRTLRRAR